MSEPSPDAKQAAYGTAERVQQAIDTATAKLREELELAWGIITNASGGDWSKESDEWVKAAINWRDRVMPMLAHQQPSAITTNEQAYRDGTLSQPSAPTAEERPEGCTCGDNWPCPLHGGPPSPAQGRM